MAPHWTLAALFLISVVLGQFQATGRGFGCGFGSICLEKTLCLAYHNLDRYIEDRCGFNGICCPHSRFSFK